jgi:two-component system, sensor histidine kinase
MTNLDNILVLVVDDSSDNRTLICRFLKKAGATTDTASNGEEAVAMATSKDYNIVLMDIQMPVKDGYTAVRDLRLSGYDRPILALTAHVYAEDKKRILSSGFSDHIAKPIHFPMLLEKIRDLCLPSPKGAST